MGVTVGASPHHKLYRVAGVLEGGRHLLVRQRPAPELVVEVVRATLQENSDRLAHVVSHQPAEVVPPPDVRETPDVTDHAVEPTRPPRRVPRHRHGSDAPKPLSYIKTI